MYPYPRAEEPIESWFAVLKELFAGNQARYLHMNKVYQRSLSLELKAKESLCQAALLHDVGITIDNSRMHSFVGGELLLNLGYKQTASLVAFHSGALIEAKLRGLTWDLDKFHPPAPEQLYLLDYLDATTSPQGRIISLRERYQDIKDRYGPNSIEARTFKLNRSNQLMGYELFKKYSKN